MKLTEIYKALKDKPLHEISDINDQIDPTKTYGDLSDEEWEAEREKMGMKTDDEGNRYLDREYDPGNEPLEIQMTPDQGEYANKIFYIEPEDIEAYVNGEDVEATNPGEREYDEVTANRQNSDVTGDSEEELEDFLVSGDRSVDDLNEQGCTEQEIAEGTCGHAPDGKVDVHNTHKMKPASSIKVIALQERFQKLANIKK